MNVSSAGDEKSPLKNKDSLLSPTSYNASQPNHNPVTFFLRSGAEIEKSMAQAEQAEAMTRNAQSAVADESITASMASTSYGVQSLEDAMSISDELSLASPQASTASPLMQGNILAGLRRKPGNPVHPKIYATGQRIVSNDLHQSTQTISPSNSPPRPQTRRTSMSPSTHLTPFNISPLADTSSSPGTPRTNSMKSLKLSDEEVSITSDTSSQVIQSSSSEEEQQPVAQSTASITSGAHRESELVMPSISVPARRPFTQRGKDIGHLKIMVVGGKGTGKSSLLRSIFRQCEDIVHIDGMTTSSSVGSASEDKASGLSSTSTMLDYQASTKPLPLWWTDVENGRTSWWRRKSPGEGVLDRNLRFIDTPGLEGVNTMDSLLGEIDRSYARLTAVDTMSDTQLLDLISGRSDNLQDVVLYLFDADTKLVSDDETSFMRELCKRTNLIPILSQSDRLSSDQVVTHKERLQTLLTDSNIDFCSLSTAMLLTSDNMATTSPQDIFAVSSLIDDGDIIDASTLMASTYIPPLHDSDLPALTATLFDPSTALHLRHQAIAKFIRWRKAQSSTSISPPDRGLLAPSHGRAEAGAGSLLDEPSKILLPDAYSSCYRSASPSDASSSDMVCAFGVNACSQSSADHPLLPTEPSRHKHIANWARDLRRSLRRDGNTRTDLHTRPAKGRLGGELGIIDPIDPLGILSLSHGLGRHGWLALQVMGGFGLVSAAVWWLSRNWLELQEWIWPGQGYATPVVVGAPARSWLDNFRLL